MKILILGNFRHGKDTAGDLLEEFGGFKPKSSSMMALDLFLYDQLKDRYGYSTKEEAFEDRKNHRPEWFKAINDYNKNDLAKLAKELLKEHNIYVGMRNYEEFLECKRQNLFDLIIWIDASERLPLEKSTSFNIPKHEADIIIENNLSFEEFKEKIKRLHKILLCNL